MKVYTRQDGIYVSGWKEDEDSDVETILNGIQRIARLHFMKMYEYGSQEVEVVV